MKNVIFLGAAVAIAASLTAGASRAEEASAAAGTSGACFNEGLYAEGAVVDFDTKISGGDVKGTYRAINTAKARKTFEGVSAIPVETETFDAKGKSEGVVTGYFEIEPGFLLILGTESKNADSTYDPAGRQPTDQKQGATYKQSYDVTTTAKGAGTQTITRQASWKFVGTETIKLPLGKIKLCKVTAKFVDKIAGFSTTTNQTIYIAAEGKYRGFALRTKTSTKLFTGQPLNTTSDVTKFRKFKPK